MFRIASSLFIVGLMTCAETSYGVILIDSVSIQGLVNAGTNSNSFNGNQLDGMSSAVIAQTIGLSEDHLGSVVIDTEFQNSDTLLLSLSIDVLATSITAPASMLSADASGSILIDFTISVPYLLDPSVIHEPSSGGGGGSVSLTRISDNTSVDLLSMLSLEPDSYQIMMDAAAASDGSVATSSGGIFVSLAFTAVPEPASLLLIMGGLSAVSYCRRRP